MFKIVRSIAITFGLIFFANLGQAQAQNQSAEQSTPVKQENPQTLPIPLPVDIQSTIKVDVVESDAAANARERSENKRAQREVDDLIAQQGMNAATQAMNEATQQMACYSLISTCLVFVGTILLLLTLRETRKANVATKEAIEVAEIAGIDQTKAFLDIEGGEYQINNRGISGFVCLVNNGNTTARRIKCETEIRIKKVWDGGFIVPSENNEINDCLLYTSPSPRDRG